MQFKQKSIAQYNKQWVSLSPTPIHQSNPQPFTLAELENLIGKAEDFDAEKELAHATSQCSFASKGTKLILQPSSIALSIRGSKIGVIAATLSPGFNKLFMQQKIAS